MTRSFNTFILIVAVSVFAIACKEPYFPSVENKDIHYLVVEGTISDGSSATTIRLSRTTDLATRPKANEPRAFVFVEDEAGNRYILPETESGTYSSVLKSLVLNKKYRLHIRTSDAKEYLSDYETLKNTPAIDKVEWRRLSKGISIGVSTHDPEKKTRYYRWSYEDTWEFHSPQTSILDYINQRIVDRDMSIPIFKCWQSSRLKSILINSTAKLSDDVVTNFRLIDIPEGDWKISVMYSMLVKQYAMSEAEYLYWEKIKKNTEDIGSIFDPQPSEIPGNIHCITDPQEQVIGFVGACSAVEKRIYISNNEVSPWTFRMGCNVIDVPDNPDSLKAAFGGESMEPLESYMDSKGRRYTGAAAECVDCRLRGTNIKPSFWP